VVRGLIALAALVLSLSASAQAETAKPPFTFWPQSGVLGQDLYLTNFVDLDAAPGSTLDPLCGNRTYDGHTGDDIVIRSFREIAIGVPVFSLTDGTVQEAARGGYDFHYGRNTSPNDNHVVVVAPDGRTLVYGHLRHDVKLRRGDTVQAGQQIGWTASSGNSSWPHLHFTELVGQGVVRDAFAGACRPGASDFVEQPHVGGDVYARNLVVSPKPFTGQAQLPWDKAVRTGTFVLGTRDVWFRVELGEWAGGDEKVQLVRPDGSIAVDASPVGVADGSRYHGQAAFAFHVRVAFDARGTWRLRYLVDGAELVDAPLTVVARAAQVRNRPPNRVALKLVLTGAHEAAQCVVSTSLVTRDPDYDVVRYRYTWRSGRKILRTVTSAGLADILRRDAVLPGQTLQCDVTPSDGRLAGRTERVTAQLPGER
jgi:hypothetical protein